jgi:CheY-like chemotaxis protein
MTTWMIVEDEPDVYEMLLAMSEILGNSGIAFVDGEEAVDWIEDVDDGDFEGEMPDLALVDIRLPNTIQGPMVGARLRQSGVLGHMPIVLMSAYKLSVDEQKTVMKEAKADLFLQKPLPSLNELQHTLEKLVQRRAAKKSHKF